MLNIQLTPKAIEKIYELALQENQEAILRIAIKGGGCSGFKYDFNWESPDKIEQDDLIKEYYSGNQMVQIVCDPISIQYMQGATLDYRTSLLESGLTFLNPNVTRQCGCGQSIQFE